MNSVFTWYDPIFIALGLLGAVAMVYSLMRVANPKSKKKPDFECTICGRKKNGLYAKEWRYCPWCGVPRPLKKKRW